MTSEELRNIIKCGETSLVQFKQEFTTQKEMATEMIAFANGRGGTILFGVKDKTGDILGLSYDEIQNTSRELGNTANEQVAHSSISRRRSLKLTIFGLSAVSRAEVPSSGFCANMASH